MHDYCLFYGKNKPITTTNLLKEVNKKFTYKDKVSGFNIHPLYNSNEAFTDKNRPNLYYSFFINPNTKDKDGFYQLSFEDKEGYIKVFPPKSVKNNVQFVWRWGKPKSTENLNKEIIGYKTPKGEFRVVQKMRHSSKLIRSILSDTSFSTRRGTSIIEDIFQNKAFTFPKPIELIKTFLEVSSNKNSIILDFFAGSGTTGHSVMELNKEDGGKRQFILCSSRENTKEAPEKNICKDITYERNKRVIEGYKIISE